VIVKILAVAFGLLLVAGCRAAGDSTTTLDAAATTVPATTATTVAASSSTTTATETTTSTPTTSAATTTTAASASESAGVLIGNSSGIFFAPPGEEPQPVADGPVLAVRDDLAGGVVAQLPGPEGRPGVVSLLPAGGEARIVLAPEGNSLVALEDVEVVGDNPTVVGTVRTAVGNPQSERQKLVTIDLVDGDRREVAVVGGYEAGGGPVSAEPNGFVLNKWLEAMNWVEFLDHGGAVREAPFNPNPECVDDVTCPRSVVASADGRLLAYLVTVPGEGVADGVDLVVADAATAEEVAREGLPVAGFATVGVDIVGDLVLVNRLAAGESGEPTEPTFPMVLDLATGDLNEVPLAGVGSLARTAPEVTGSLH
jgi:hypothetical protein